MLEHALRSQLPGAGAVSRQHAMNCARAASSSAFASSGCEGGFPDDVSNFAYTCVHALAGGMRPPRSGGCAHRTAPRLGCQACVVRPTALAPPTCLDPYPNTTINHVDTHAHTQPRSNALATEASLPYTAASDGCPAGQLLTVPTAEFPQVGSVPGAQPAPGWAGCRGGEGASLAPRA